MINLIKNIKQMKNIQHTCSTDEINKIIFLCLSIILLKLLCTQNISFSFSLDLFVTDLSKF